MSEAEFEVGGEKYRATKMGVLVQFHLARKIAPLMMPVAEALASQLGGKLGDKLTADGLKDVSPDQIALFAGPVIDALGRMTDDEANDIIFPCLAVVQRYQTVGWQPLLATGSRSLMFEDINLQTMLQLVWQVLAANLAGFFQDVPSK